MNPFSPALWRRSARDVLRLLGRIPSALPRAGRSIDAGAIKAEEIASLNPAERRRAAQAIAAGIEFLLPTRELDAILPGADRAEVCMLPRHIRRHGWAMPEHELLTLGAVTRMIDPRFVVELGTFQGGSTLVMAANMDPGGRIVTVDLDPSQQKSHEHGLGTGFEEFDLGSLFRGTRFEPMIEQRYSNTLHVAADDLVGTADLVFVDADHTYPFATRDTATALEFVRPGGWIVWHDYTWLPENSECAGVTRAVNEFFQRHGNCFHIAGTRFAIHQAGAARASAPREHDGVRS